MVTALPFLADLHNRSRKYGHGASGVSADAERLVDGVVASRIEAIGDKRHVAQHTDTSLGSPGPDGNEDAESDIAEVYSD